MKKTSVFSIFFGLIFLLPAVGPAQTNFYDGKTLTVVLSTDPAGTSSVRLRPLVPYLRKHIPGNPTIVVDYMEGGGGRKGANHVFRSARPDGLTVGALSGSVIALSIAWRERHHVRYQQVHLSRRRLKASLIKCFIREKNLVWTVWISCGRRAGSDWAPSPWAIPDTSPDGCLPT